MDRRNFLLSALAGLVLAGGAGAAQAATTCVSQAAGSPYNVTLSFVAPTLNTDGSAITGALTYNVLMGTASGAETLLTSGLSGSPITVTAGIVGGKSYYFEVTVTEAGFGTSSPSNEVCKAMLTPVPGTVTITIADNKLTYEFRPFAALGDNGSPESLLF